MFSSEPLLANSHGVGRFRHMRDYQDIITIGKQRVGKFLDCVFPDFAQSKQLMSYHFFPPDYLNTKMSQVNEQSQKLVSTLFLAFFIVMELGWSTKDWHELLQDEAKRISQN